MKNIWHSLEGKIDLERYNQVASLLEYQEREAIWWRDGCVLFFQQYSQRPLPEGCQPPAHDLKYYQSIPFPYDWKGYYD